MPIPTPNEGEEKKDFTSRCMGDEVMVKEYPNPDQRYAVCVSKYEEKKTVDLAEELSKKTSL